MKTYSRWYASILTLANFKKGTCWDILKQFACYLRAKTNHAKTDPLKHVDSKHSVGGGLAAQRVWKFKCWEGNWYIERGNKTVSHDK